MQLSIDKLDDINYATWESYVKLWLKNQWYVNNLTSNVTIIPSTEVTCWQKNGAQL